MKILRRLVLASFVLALTFSGLPVRDALARLSRRSTVAAHRRGNHRHCRHSRAWWRRHRERVRVRQERAVLLRRQRRQAALEAARVRSFEITPTFQPKAVTAAAAPAADKQRAAQAANIPSVTPISRTAPISRMTQAAPPIASPAMTTDAARTTVAAPTFRKTRAGKPEASAAPAPRRPFDFAPPQTWRLSGASGRGEMKFAVMGRDGRAAGTATLAPVSLAGPSAALDVVTPRTKLIGGVALPVLRRTIIDRMIVEGGWVTNDMEREIDGRRVYVVTAQTGQGGVARDSWTFYFTEIGDRLYSLATNAPVEFSAPLAAGSEQVLATLSAGGGSGALAAKPQR